MENSEQVAIAKDVLKHLNAKLILAEAGVWIDFGPGTDHAGTINDLIKGREFECKVCADGALFVAYMLRKYDALACRGEEELGWRSAQQIEATIGHLFSHDQMILIDVAFERGKGYYNYKMMDEDVRKAPMTEAFQNQLDRARDFCDDISHKLVRNDETGEDDDSGADARLRKIMNNIIENQGVFTP